MQFAGQGLGHFDPAANNNYIYIGTRTPQVIVTHVTAYDKGPQTFGIDDTLYAAENGSGQRHVI